jgi:hypothetical protein
VDKLLDRNIPLDGKLRSVTALNSYLYARAPTYDAHSH